MKPTNTPGSRSIVLLLSAGVLHATASPALAQVAQEEPAAATIAVPLREVYALATLDLDFGAGTLVALGPPPAWEPMPTGIEVGNEAHVRAGGGYFLVIDHERDELLILGRQAELLHRLKFEIGSELQDVAVLGPRRVVVSRRGSPVLDMVDPVRGTRTPWIDLSVLEPDPRDGNPNPSCMIVHAGRLYVGLQRLDPVDTWISADHGGLAVIDIASATIVDVEATAPGVQPIELTGPHPRLKMAIDPTSQRLFVSATRPFHLDFNGGIEMIDLASLRSQGFLVSEMDIAALSSFVVTSPGAGFLMFHTDIVASSHLVPFDIPSGTVYGPEVALELFRYFDSIAFDRRSDTVLMPTISGVFHIIDASARLHIGDTPVLGEGSTIDVAFRTWGP